MAPNPLPTPTSNSATNDERARLVAAAADMQKTLTPKEKVKRKKLMASLPSLEFDAEKCGLTIVRQSAEIDVLRSRLEEATVIALRTDHNPRDLKHPVSVLQIAVRNKEGKEEVFILDLIVLAAPEYDDVLLNCFTSTKCIKLGQSFLSDLQALHSVYPTAKSFVQIHNIVEVNALLQHVTENTAFLSLEKLASVCLSQRLPKGAQDWNQRPLIRDQLTFAAVEALSLLYIYDKLAVYNHAIGKLCHKWNVGEKIKIPCSKCHRSFGSAMALSQHASKCVPPPPVTTHKCDVCKSSFKTAEKLEQHVVLCQKKHAQQTKPQHACTECKRKFTTELGLQHHMDTHREHPLPKVEKEKKKYPCTTCTKKFKTKASMKKHADTCKPKTNDQDTKLKAEQKVAVESPKQTTESKQIEKPNEAAKTIEKKLPQKTTIETKPTATEKPKTETKSTEVTHEKPKTEVKPSVAAEKPKPAAKPSVSHEKPKTENKAKPEAKPEVTHEKHPVAPVAHDKPKTEAKPSVAPKTDAKPVVAHEKPKVEAKPSVIPAAHEKPKTEVKPSVAAHGKSKVEAKHVVAAVPKSHHENKPVVKTTKDVKPKSSPKSPSKGKVASKSPRSSDQFSYYMKGYTSSDQMETHEVVTPTTPAAAAPKSPTAAKAALETIPLSDDSSRDFLLDCTQTYDAIAYRYNN